MADAHGSMVAPDVELYGLAINRRIGGADRDDLRLICHRNCHGAGRPSFGRRALPGDGGMVLRLVWGQAHRCCGTTMRIGRRDMGMAGYSVVCRAAPRGIRAGDRRRKFCRGAAAGGASVSTGSSRNGPGLGRLRQYRDGVHCVLCASMGTDDRLAQCVRVDGHSRRRDLGGLSRIGPRRSCGRSP